MVDALKNFISKMVLTDAIVMIYCLFQILYVAVFGPNLDDLGYIIAVYLTCLTVAMLSVHVRSKINNRFVRIITLLYPIALLIPFYEISGHQVHMFFPGFYDNVIIKFEHGIFDVHPTVWMQQFNYPWLTELMMFGYSFYVLLIPITTAWLYCTHKSDAWQHMLGALLISFFISYVIFSLFPIEGPRYALASHYNVHFNGFLFKRITAILENTAMLHGGAFPSAHCSAATVMLVLSFKYDKKLFLWVAPIIITLYIATVYGRYHYPTDVIGGMIVGLIGVWLYWPIKRLWENVVLRMAASKAAVKLNRND
jgi:membrane-associated phospholipid phosphatase